jgi:carbon monoxide dehydrogenase subunit G
MDMTGEYRIKLPQALVWRALNDPEILKASVPGCEELIRTSETGFKGRIAAAVGPVRAKFAGEATLSDIDPPNGYTLTGGGSGGAAGMAKGSAAVRLATDAGETVLTYEVRAQVAGKLAQIGSRLIDMAAKKMADDFFANFVRQIEPAALAEAPAAAISAAAPPPEPEPTQPEAAQTEPAQTEPAGAPKPDPVAPASAPAETSSRSRVRWLIWAAAAIIALAVIVAIWKGFD